MADHTRTIIDKAPVNTPSLVRRYADKHTLAGQPVGLRTGQSRFGLRQRTSIDNLACATTVQRIVDWRRAKADNLAVSDAKQQSTLRNRSKADNVAAADAKQQSTLRNRSKADNLAVATALARYAVRNFLAADNVGLRTAFSQSTLRNITKADNLAIATAAVQSVLRNRALADTVGIRTAVILGARTISLSIVNKLALSTLALQSVARMRSISNKVGIEGGERGEGYMVRQRQPSDGLAIYTDIVQIRNYRQRVVSDIVAIQDALLRLAIRNLSLASTVGIRTGFSLGARTVSLSLSNSLAVATAKDQSTLRIRLKSDAIALQDSIVQGVLRIRAVVNQLGITDLEDEQVFRNRQLSDVVAIATDHVLAKFAQYVYIDTIGVGTNKLVQTTYYRLAQAIAAFGTDADRIADYFRHVSTVLGLADDFDRTFIARLIQDAIALRTAGPSIRRTLLRLATTSIGMDDDQAIAQTIAVLLMSIVGVNAVYLSHINPVSAAVQDDGVGVTTDADRTVQFKRLVANLLGTSTAVARVVSVFRSVADRLGVGTEQAVEKIILPVTHLLLLTEGVAISTDADRSATSLRKLIDNLGMRDDVDRVRDAVRQLAESVGIRTALVQKGFRDRRVLDGLEIVTGCLVAKTVYKQLATAVGTQTASMDALAALRLLSDSLGVDAELTDENMAFGFRANDAVGIGGDLDRVVDYRRKKLDGLAVADLLAGVGHFAVIAAAIADEIGIATDTDDAATWFRSIASRVAAGDDASRAVDWYREIESALAIADDTAKLVTYHRMITNTLGLIDDVLEGHAAQPRAVDWGIEAWDVFVAGARAYECAGEGA